MAGKDPAKMWAIRGTMKKVQGVPLLEPIVTHWKRVETFRAFPEDVLIATYPKAGTTWIQEIVDLIFNHGDAEKARRAPLHIRMPFLEMTAPDPTFSGITLLEKMQPPRIIKTHLPIQLIPNTFWEAGCKVIYVARNPKDTVVSYFNFERMNLITPEPGPWPQYLDKFMKGQLGWGSWSDHVKGYWREKERKQILYLFYEDMKETPAKGIRQIADFLGQQLSEDIVSNIVQMTTFAAMRENPMANYSTVPDTIFDRKASDFLRKGEVGDWQNHFSPEENAAFEEHYIKAMAGCNIPFRFSLPEQ
ncbi:sulfotransferase family 1, cytosolic sulfotransferase 5 isoform X2 [Myripristis murdjan]|uniref:sulfotransferase family 1, cytosolic sulfotransferase 5 isoform X2 n=1 Tax=Myripristis murdjan TaxID=586833 RepID=UPI001175D065|nr:sulfotransferase family cytosolic 1B member 1-like isoform X2 [Myripristis murdjan]